MGKIESEAVLSLRRTPGRFPEHAGISLALQIRRSLLAWLANVSRYPKNPHPRSAASLRLTGTAADLFHDIEVVDPLNVPVDNHTDSRLQTRTTRNLVYA